MLKYNDTEVKKITYNGTSIRALIYNGTLIFKEQITTGPYKMCDLYPDKYRSMTTVPNRVVFCGTTAKEMFRNCSGLRSIDTSGIDLSEATDTSYMFSNCGGLTSLNLSSFDTSNVTDMGYMFSSCSSLTSLNLSSFNTSNVTNMSRMFYGCSGLTSLDISSFNTSNVTNMSKMFNYCDGLTSITGIFDLSSITDAGNLQNMLYRTLVTSITFKNVKSSIAAKITTNLLRMPSNGKITIQNTI